MQENHSAACSRRKAQVLLREFQHRSGAFPGPTQPCQRTMTQKKIEQLMLIFTVSTNYFWLEIVQKLLTVHRALCLPPLLPKQQHPIDPGSCESLT